jgi:hypothetical protein
VSTPGWERWWLESGERELAFILWALWDPGLGGPDDYEHYVPKVQAVLREGGGLGGEIDALAALLRRERLALGEHAIGAGRDRDVAIKIWDWYTNYAGP